MKWQLLNKLLMGIIAVGGVITLSILFSGIDELAGVQVTYHSPDQVCRDCIAEFHINSTYWEICFEHSERDEVIFKKSSRGRRLWVNLNKIALTEPEIPIEILVPTYGKKLRLMKDGDCIHRYSKKRPSINKIFIKGSPGDTTIKVDVPFLDVDIVWLGYEYVYDNKERIGVSIGGKYFSGNVNIQDNKLIEWSYPIGDRNFEEYGLCREYELQKGVCTETNILT